MLAPPRRRARRVTRLAALLAVGALASACGGALGTTTVAPSDARAAMVDLAGWRAPDLTPEQPDRRGLQEALDEVAAAFLAGDPATVAAFLLDPTSDFGQRWQDRARWMQDLPLGHYALVVEPAIGDLASGALRARLPGAQVVYVVEELGITGFDPPGSPAREDLFLTVVPGPDGWRVAGDADAEALGFVSVDHLWDLGPVTLTRLGDVAAIHRPTFVGVEQLLGEAQRALDIAAQRWPLPFPPAVPILVPGSEAELAELLHVTFDLSNFVAFATATSFGEGLVYELSGSRIVVNPDRFLQRATATRELILVHEFVHVATHRVAGVHVPNWLDEGVAQAIGERRSATGRVLLDQLVTAGFDGTPPTDTNFRIGGQNRVFLSYQEAWSLVDFLTRRFGVDAVASFYAVAGVGSVAEPGSEGHRLDVAAQEAFGLTIDEVQAAWAVDLRG